MRTLHTSPMALFTIKSRAYEVIRFVWVYITQHAEKAVGVAHCEQQVLLQGELVQLARLFFR